MSLKFRFSRSFLLCALLTLLWMIVIFLFSAQNGEESSYTSGKLLRILCDLIHYNPPQNVFNTLSFILRKAAHMTEFGILALLWLGTLHGGFGRFRGMYPAAFAVASLYAATDEIHQLFVSDRAGQFTDWLVDSAGALLFLLLAWGVSIIWSKRRQNKENTNYNS